MNRKLEGKVALITGGSSGIGAATAGLLRETVLAGRPYEDSWRCQIAFPVVNSYRVPYSFSFAEEPTRQVPPRQSKKEKSNPAKHKRQKSARRQTGKLFEDLVALQARLRAPGGCPWDREQSHQTLKTYLIEEAYEVLDALDHLHRRLTRRP